MPSKLKLSIFLFFYTAIALAEPINKFSTSIGLEIENSDNIFLSPTNKKSDNIFHETFAANYTRNSPTVQTDFSLNADHQHYQDKSFSDQNYFSSLLGFNAILIKNRLNWRISNRFDRVQTSTATLNLPTNQENTNSFSTGPTLIILRTDRQLLTATLNYNKIYTQKSNADSSGYTAIATYNRNLTRTFAVKLAVNHNVKNFVNTQVNTDYKRTDSTVSFLKRLRLSEIDITAGRTVIVRKGASNVEHGIFRAGYKYHLGDKASLAINYSRELGDFTGVFSSANQTNTLLPSVGSEIFVMEQGSVTATRNFGKSSIQYGFMYFTANYTNDALDTAAKTSTITYLGNISSSLELSLSGAYSINSYNASTRKDTAEIYTGMLTKRLSGVYALTCKLQYANRNSNFASFSYDERRITLGGRYYF